MRFVTPNGASFSRMHKCSELWLPLPLEVCMKTYSRLNQNRFLSHVRTILCALAILGGSLAFPSSAADRAGHAMRTPEPAGGGFFPCFNYAGLPRQVGENLIITFNVTADVTGTLDGSLVGTELDVVHPDGSINLYG